MFSGLDDLLNASELPGVVATVLVDGDNVYSGASGLRQVGNDSPMTVDTVLAIFSMTKAWATQLFPFQDPTVVAELEAFESAVYAALDGAEHG